MKRIIHDLSLKQLEDLLIEEFSEKKFRALQLYQGLMLGKSITEISTLSKSLKDKLLTLFEDKTIEIIKEFTSKDGTKKFLFQLADGNCIEGVFMQYKHGNTQCVSTQVGCRMGCVFCASTKGGLIRNLTSGEILAQVLAVNARMGGNSKQRAVTNIVLMGSGEPLDNYQNTVNFLRNVSAPEGICISTRNISLSTCGLVPEMKKLADEGLSVNLTVSLHNSQDKNRQNVMPIAKVYSIQQILEACSYYFERTGRRYIFEYSLIAGENASKEDADKLIALLKGRPCHVNCIQLNAIQDGKLIGTTEKEAYQFVGMLEKGGLSATLRRKMGDDIGGACGQLRANYLNL